MGGLLSKLQSAGIPSAFAQKMLPNWWDDEVAEDPAGLQQAQLYLARAFNIEIQSLASVGEVPRFRVTPRKFKLNRNVVEDKVLVSANYVTGIARVAMQGFPAPQEIPPISPSALRKTILSRHQCVGLDALLEWCSSAGIPVMHIENLPGRKMTGLVVRDDGRYSIVLSKRGHPSLLLFHLAHEIGHIALGHLSDDGVMADEKIDDTGSDLLEKAADVYAVCLLNGSDVRYGAANGIGLNARSLYEAAVRKGAEVRVDVGHIIANYGHHQKRYAVASLALQSLGEPTQGGTVINAAFFQSIDEELLSGDQLELLKTATSFQQ